MNTLIFSDVMCDFHHVIDLIYEFHESNSKLMKMKEEGRIEYNVYHYKYWEDIPFVKFEVKFYLNLNYLNYKIDWIVWLSWDSEESQIQIDVRNENSQ